MDFNIESTCKSIETAYHSLGHQLGWRFINSSINTVHHHSGICMITLNPSGSYYQESVCHLTENKNAYLDESWGNRSVGQDKLQLQIQYMFEELHKRISTYETSEDMMRNSLMAHFIPFRSNVYDDLVNKKQSVEFSTNLWRSYINSERFSFSTIICIGKVQFDAINSILQTSNGYHLTNTKNLSTGWGVYQAEVKEYVKNEKQLKVVYLQHLSRFSIFNRKENKGKNEIKELFDYIIDSPSNNNV